MSSIAFRFERRVTAVELTGLDVERLRALASLRTGAPVDHARPGLPLGVSADEQLEVWRGDGETWSGVAWVTEGGDLVIFAGDEAAPSNHTIQGGFELDDTVSAADRSHACRGEDCWGCAIERA